MIALALIVGAATLAVGVVATLALRTLPSVRLQLTGLALLAVSLPLSAVVLSGLMMFHLKSEAEVLAVSGAASVAAIVGALILARDIMHRLDRVRAASVSLAAGYLGARAPEGGPSELADLATSFNAMAGHLERAFDARRELVAWASHDLRAPITSLQAMLEAIEDGVVEYSEYQQTLQSQVRHLAALVDDLFELSCIDAGAAILHIAPTDIDDLVASSMARIGPEAQGRQVRLVTVASSGGAWAECAPDKVDRVLGNLLTNALRHTPPGGSITASVACQADGVLICVEDTGAGIGPEALERVFEPFWRGDTARNPSAGRAGLGLAIARGLINAQGGRIWVEPPSGVGTQVCFVLPAAEPATARPTLKGLAPTTGPTSTTPASAGPTSTTPASAGPSSTVAPSDPGPPTREAAGA